MNWGYKILIVYIVFIAGIVTLVVKSSMQNQDLVATDYYEQELKYQDKIDAMKNAGLLSDSVKLVVTSDEIIITFPEELKGQKTDATILLYNPVDVKKDIQKHFSTDRAIVHFPLQQNNKGMHQAKISWSANGINYYHEKKIMLP